MNSLLSTTTGPTSADLIDPHLFTELVSLLLTSSFHILSHQSGS